MSKEEPELVTLSWSQRVYRLMSGTNSIGLLVVFVAMVTSFTATISYLQQSNEREELEARISVSIAEQQDRLLSLTGEIGVLVGRIDAISDEKLKASLREQAKVLLQELDRFAAQSRETNDLLMSVYRRSAQTTTIPINLVSAALAQSETGSSLADESEAIRSNSIEYWRPYVMLAVLVCVTMFFFICLGMFVFSKDEFKLKFADSMIRTVVGFYIGIVTGLLGLPK